MSIATLLSSFEDARRENDRPAAAEFLRSALERSLSTGEKVPRSSWYDLSALMFGQGRLTEAERWAREGLKRHRRDAPLQNLLGVVLKNQGRLEEARKTLEATTRLDPKLKAGWVNLGNVLLG